jgi:hypothetical protein
MSEAESPLYKLLRKQSLAFLAAAVLASVCLILIGAMLEQDDTLWARLLLTLGSSGLGTCLGLVFGSLTGSSALQRVKDLVEKTLNSNLTAPESELQPFRKMWHHYLVTHIDGKPVWRYRTFDFAKTIVPGKLIATLTVPGPDKRAHVYTIEAFVTAPRALFVQKSAYGAEAPAIHVYPFATEHFRAVIAGTVFLQSWDGAQLGAPALMSESPIELGVATPVEGTLPDSTYAKLDELWGKQASQLGLLLKGRV